MNISAGLKKNWLAEALFLALLWFPPLGALALYHIFQTQKSLQNGHYFQARRSSVNTRTVIKNGILYGIGLQVILAAVVFTIGSEWIPILSTFY